MAGGGHDVAARRLQSGAGDEAGNHEIDYAALGPELVALVEESFGLIEMAQFVHQLAEECACKSCGM